MTNYKNLPEMQNVAEQIGEFIHYWGFKRIHGRIWSHLFLSKRPLDASDLVTQLRISKALVSISLRELMEYDVVRDVGKSERGTNLYSVNSDLLGVVSTVLREREKRLLARIEGAQAALDRVSAEDKTAAGLSQSRVEQLQSLVHSAAFGLESLMSLAGPEFSELKSAFSIASNEPEAPVTSPASAPGFAVDARAPRAISETIHQARVAEEAPIVLIGRPLFP
jgi:DNA-binding transcriptional regulator GbsR (MarR family)